MARKCMNAIELAGAIGCSKESIQQIISGRRNAPIKKLGQIAKALEVDPAECDIIIYSIVRNCGNDERKEHGRRKEIFERGGCVRDHGM